jgi:peptidoglycan/LPS O-acetylase OafA/YrhL
MLLVSFILFLSIATYAEFYKFYELKPWYAPLQISNWSFAYNNTDYWNPETQTLFLHTWSLGVEEQFYLIYPIFILLIFWSNGKPFSYILWISIFSLISLYFFISLPFQKAFYLPYGRGYQFFIGGITYYICSIYLKEKVNINNVILSITYYFMVILLVGSVFLSKNMIPYVSIYITILTAIIILLGCYANHKFIADNKILLGIGNISYSLYLWHFPVIILYKMLHLTLTGNELQLLDFLYIGTITLLISLLSYKYVEQPFRKTSKNKKIRVLVFATALIIIFGLAYLFNIPYHNKLKTFTKQNSDNLQRDIYLDNWKKIDNKSKKSVLFIGDSHAEERMRAMSTWAKENDFNIMMATYGGFWDLLKFPEKNKIILKFLTDETLKTVVILTVHNVSSNILKDILEVKPDLEFIILEDSFGLLYKNYKCVRKDTILYKYFSFLSHYLSGDKCMIINTESIQARRDRSLKEIEDLQKKGVNIVFIQNKVNKIKYKDKWIFRDNSHLSNAGMSYIEEERLLDFKSMYSYKNTK